MLLNVLLVLVQGVKLADVLGELVVHSGQLLGLDFMELNLKHGGLALELLGVVVLGEGDVHVELVAHAVAHHLVLKAGDELAGAQGQLVVVGLAAAKLLAVQVAVEIDGDDVAVLSGAALYGNHAGVALAHAVNLAVHVLAGDFHGRAGDLDALVALDGGLGLGDHIQLAQDAFVFADLVNLEFADADDLQAGFLHSLHHHGAVQVVDGGLVKDLLAVIFLDERPGGMALAEAGDIHLFALPLVNGVDGFVKFLGADFQLQLIAVGFHFVGRFYIHVSDFLSK